MKDKMSADQNPSPTDQLPAPSLHSPEKADIHRSYMELSSDQSLLSILDALSEAVVILNQQRQIVLANKASLEAFGIDAREQACGLRPGELLFCNHAAETTTGCGTTEFCRLCGSNIAIIASQLDQTSVRECRITRKSTGTAIDLRVKAVPWEFNGEKFTIFSIVDISDEKRREVLQRIFLHDILNTAGGLCGYAELLLDASHKEAAGYKAVIHNLSLKIIDEINSQRQLIAAENGTLDVLREEISSLAILESVIQACKHWQGIADRTIKLAADSTKIMFKSDIVLLFRVLANLIKNALEATDPNHTVTVGCRQSDNRVEFYVNNHKPMTEPVKLQVFQRSFSTKGQGHGLGTYSVKLLTETYLQGTVRFESIEPAGTTFYVCYPINAV